MHVLVQNDDLSRRLNPLLSVWGEDLPCQPVRQATGSGIISNRIARRRTIHKSFSARLERTHLCWVVCRDAWRMRITGSDAMSEAGAGPHSGEIGLTIRHARNGLPVDQHGNEREDRNQSESSHRGTTSSADPAKTFRPSANVTFPPEPLLDPSLARKPST